MSVGNNKYTEFPFKYKGIGIVSLYQWIYNASFWNQFIILNIHVIIRRALRFAPL